MRIFLLLLLLPILLLAQSPTFTGFGQVTLPTAQFGQSAPSVDATVKAGYGGGIDLNIHFNESTLWLTTLAFSANDLKDNLSLSDWPIRLDSPFSVYTLPVLTGIAAQRAIGFWHGALWLQAGLCYAEFPAISGAIISGEYVQQSFDSQINGQTNFGFSFGGRIGYKNLMFGVRYMNFGDYTFDGNAVISNVANKQPLMFRMQISFIMINVGYNLDLMGEK